MPIRAIDIQNAAGLVEWEWHDDATGDKGKVNYTFDLMESVAGFSSEELFSMPTEQYKKDVFERAMLEYQHVANVSFHANPGANASTFLGLKIFEGILSDPTHQAVSRLGPVGQTVHSYGLLVGKETFGVAAYKPSSIGYLAALHELGHVLGLDDVSGGDYFFRNTIMDGVGPFDGAYSLTPMIYDILALQAIYGKPDIPVEDTTITLNGNTVIQEGRTYQGTDKTALTIWDSGGDHDGLDVSSYTGTEDTLIDLREGFDEAGNQYVTNVGKTVLFLAFGATIENAIGSKNADSITGSDLANTLAGGLGKDTIHGGDGADVIGGKWLFSLGEEPSGTDVGDSLFGGKGDDTIYGGEGNDSLYGEEDNDTLFINDFDRASGNMLLDGGPGNDYISGGRMADTLRGGADKDYLLGWEGNDSIEGGTGNDVLIGGENNDTLEGGADKDMYYFFSGDGTDVVNDDGPQDRIHMGLAPLEGLARTVEGGNYTLNGYTVEDQGGSLKITGGGVDITLTQWVDGDYGIKLEDTTEGGGGGSTIGGGAGDDDLWDPCAPISHAGSQFAGNFISPIVLDLNGQIGLQLSQVADSHAFFDLDNDGFAEHPGWSSEEGFLIADLNTNNLIDNQTEMFGQTPGSSAWDKLAPYDTDGNGTIEGAERDPLGIWIDANGNGRTDPGELLTLQDAGVASINLTNTNNHFFVGNHEIIGGGSWEKTGGGAGSYYDVFFETDQLNSWYVGDDLANPPPVDIETLLLPLSRGYGNMKALHYAMTDDAALMAKVEGLVSTTSYSTLSAQVVDILLDWAGADGLDAHGRGTYIDGRLLGFLEALNDTDYVSTNYLGIQSPYPTLPETAGNLITAWSEAFTELKERILAQSTFSDILGDVTYDFSADSLHLGDTLAAILARAAAGEPTDGTQALWFWRELGGILVHNADDFGLSEAAVKAQLDTAAGQSVMLFDSFLEGTSAAEEFTGGDGSDYFLGYDGNDKIRTYGGNDSVDGGLGNDSILGGDGDDTLYGGDGNDTLKGEAGSDLLMGGDGNDSLVDDQVLSGAGNDTLYGGAGDDTLSAYYGDNLLDGGDGKDRLNAGAGADTLLGGAGNDTLNGNSGNNYLDGGADNDLMYGDDGDDSLFGGTGNDTLRADAGNDTLIGGMGLDSMLGGTGADMFVFLGLDESTTTQRDIISDFVKGEDKIDLSAITSISGFGALTIALSAGNTLVSYGSSFSIKLTGDFTQGANTLTADDFVFGTSTITGTAGNDSLTGTAAAETLLGLAGNDTLDGGAGNDTLDGGSGKDMLTGGTGADVFKFSSLTDSYHTGSNYDRITDFQVGVDKIDLTGLGFTALVTGGSTQTGELRLTYSSTSDRTYVRSDQVDFEFYFDGDKTGTVTNADFIFEGGSGGGGADDTITGSASAETLTGTSLNEIINGLGGNDTLDGGAGNDTLDGGSGKDMLTGGTGADVFKFSSLTDSYHTGSNYDRITDFQVGVDKIDLTGLGFTALVTGGSTQTGELRLTYSSTSDRTYVRSDQVDFEFYFDGDKTGTVTNADFIFEGGSGGGGADDTITGSASAETLTGTSLNEIINGLGGNDTLDGGAGNDTLDGGSGKDMLTGGTGADVFKFSSLTDSYHTGSNYDRITDFQAGVDKVDLTGLGFTGLDTDGGSTETGELRLTYSSTSDRTYVRSDQVDFEFYFDGDKTGTVTDVDFVF